MPPVMRISDRNWQRLKTWATPLEDSADDALGKVLSAAEAKKPNRPLIPDGSLSNGHKVPETVHGAEQEDTMDTEADIADVNPPVEIRRLPRGQRVPQQEYVFPILESLYELGGKGQGKDVLTEVEKKVKHLLGEIDYELVSNDTQTRWSNTGHFARLSLVKRGWLKPVEESGRGIWELTEQGIAEVEKRRR